eukprot:COSAG05_NODE_1209_length_5506_cov_3.412613_3_plen_330_part_00
MRSQGTTAAKTAGCSFLNTAGSHSRSSGSGNQQRVNATASVGSPCGFSLEITADGGGPLTVALFGSASVPLSVTAAVDGEGKAMDILQSLELTTRLQEQGTLVDTHVHVTINGRKGEKVTLVWKANFTAPAPAPTPKQHRYNFTTLSDTACIPQHGASAQLGSSHERNASACTAACAADDHCSCAVFTAHDGQCEWMAQCLPSQCTHSAQSATLVKDYQVIDGLNCYRGHGATELDKTPVPDLSQEECIERCEGTASCTGAVHSRSGPKKGDCWMRADIMLAKCAHIAFQSMLIKPTAATLVPRPPNVGLHAAVVARGGPPELPGFEAA